jgi:hypothetical protein
VHLLTLACHPGADVGQKPNGVAGGCGGGCSSGTPPSSAAGSCWRSTRCMRCSAGGSARPCSRPAEHPERTGTRRRPAARCPETCAPSTGTTTRQPSTPSGGACSASRRATPVHVPRRAGAPSGPVPGLRRPPPRPERGPLGWEATALRAVASARSATRWAAAREPMLGPPRPGCGRGPQCPMSPLRRVHSGVRPARRAGCPSHSAGRPFAGCDRGH